MSTDGTRKPSIVITYPFALGTRAAGGSRTTPQVARHLGRLGADVTILTVSTNPLDRRFPRSEIPASELGFHLDEELAPDGVRIVRVPQHWLHYLFDPRRVKDALARILNERKVDAVLVHFNEAGALGGLLRRHGTTLAVLATWQTYAILSRKHPGLWGGLKSWLQRRYTVRPHCAAEIVFAISEFTKRELVEILGVDPTRVVIAPLGVEQHFTEVPRARPEKITRLLFFGRVTPSKGFRDAIEALGILRERGITDLTFRIVGAGRHEWAREAAEKHGVAERVELVDSVDDAGLCRELEAAHLAVMPSHAESFGLSIAEAQGAGIPVVAYAAGSVPEVVEDGVTGWLAPLFDVTALADCIEAAVRDPEGTYRAGLAARERVKRLYHWENTARIVLEGIERVRAGKP